jgi:cell division protein FtsL
MTHQAESKMNAKLSGVLRVIVLGIVAVFAVGIFAYNGSLSVRRQFTAERNRLDELQILNADLKNKLYSLTDAKTLSSVAIRLGLVVEKNPQYLHVGDGALVAQRN